MRSPIQKLKEEFESVFMLSNNVTIVLLALKLLILRYEKGGYYETEQNNRT